MQSRDRRSLALLLLLLLHILGFCVTAAPFRNLVRKQGATSIETEDVSGNESIGACVILPSKKKTLVSFMYMFCFHIHIRPAFAYKSTTAIITARNGPPTWTRAFRYMYMRMYLLWCFIH